MDRWPPDGVRARVAETPRCPECGSGELFFIDVVRRDGRVWRGAYCAGLYDHERRRFLARSCGYAGARAIEPPAPADGAIAGVAI